MEASMPRNGRLRGAYYRAHPASAAVGQAWDGPFRLRGESDQSGHAGDEELVGVRPWKRGDGRRECDQTVEGEPQRGGIGEGVEAGGYSGLDGLDTKSFLLRLEGAL